MLNLVVAENTLQLLLGWEIMGLCSFMLIGHWWEEKKNSDAALKAFFTTRTGDIGLLVGIVVIFWGARSFRIEEINVWAMSGDWSRSVIFWGALALFIGIIGKSGQFPLHTWLPDAMAGPTPVSALIHAATMVVAGVYLGARLYPVFFQGFKIADGPINPMALIGGITIIIAAVLAFVQVDIKKVLAYSTVSQLGYMVMGLGVGAWTPAVFHIFTHAFFKALPVPRPGLGEPLRLAPLLRHEEGHGRAVAQDADHLRDVRHRHDRPHGHPDRRRLLLEGRDHRQRRQQRLHGLHDRRPRRRVPDGGRTWPAACTSRSSARTAAASTASTSTTPIPERVPAMALAHGAEPMAEEAGGTFVIAEDDPDEHVSDGRHGGDGPRPPRRPRGACRPGDRPRRGPRPRRARTSRTSRRR